MDTKKEEWVILGMKLSSGDGYVYGECKFPLAKTLVEAEPDKFKIDVSTTVEEFLDA